MVYNQNLLSWNPNLYVKNALGDVKEEVINELVDHLDEPINKNHKNYDIIYVWEIRKVVGTFWKKNLNEISFQLMFNNFHYKL